MTRPLMIDWASPSFPYTVVLLDRTGAKHEVSFRLTFDFRALALVEAHTGLSLLTQAGAMFQEMSVTNLTIMFWAAIQASHPEYAGKAGLEAVRSYFTLGNVEGMCDAVQEAFLVSLPPEQEAAIRASLLAEKTKSGIKEEASSPLASPVPASA